MEPKKKIIIVRSSYSPIGGVERVALSLIQGLLEKGVAVTLLSLPRQPWPISHPKLEIVSLGDHRGHRLYKAWAFNRAVNRYLERHTSTCIFSLDKVTTFTHLHAGGGTHKTFLGIKNQYSSPPSRLLRKLSLFHRYVIHLEKMGFENPRLQKIRCNSRMVMDMIQKDYKLDPEKLVLIHSGIRWQEMEEGFLGRKQMGQRLCRENSLDPMGRYLLFLGNEYANKGLDIAIKGLNFMPRDYHLVVVGKGNAYPYARLASSLGMKKRVHFLGAQPQGWRYASFCKALVLPSHFDPFGGASAEGHAMGVPVLVSDMTGYADWVVDDQNGVLLKTPMTDHRIRDAFNRLNQLIDHPKQTPRQLREHARNVDDQVILEQLMDRFLSLERQ